MHIPEITSDYLYAAILISKSSTVKHIGKMVKLLNKYDYDALAFRGMSGALLAPILALKCKKTLMMVRKPKSTDTHHSMYLVEGDRLCKRYIIIDDFISSGRTMKEIIYNVHAFAPEAICVGAMLYMDILKGYESSPRIQSVTEHVADAKRADYAAVNPDQYRIEVEAK